MNYEKVKGVHQRLAGRRDCIIPDSWPKPPIDMRCYKWPSTLRKATHLW